MFSFLRFFLSNRAAGKGRISPLLLSKREIERLIRKEKLRCDRHQITFSLIFIELYSTDHQFVSETKALAKIIHRRVRFTDEKGHISDRKLGILLPHTNRAGAQVVLDEISETASRKEIYFKSEIYCYPTDSFLQNPAGDDSVESGELVPTSSDVEDDQLSAIQGAATMMAFQSSCYPKWKRLMDIAGAGIGLVIAAPVIAIAALAIKLNSKGPVFFLQDRTGFLGERFVIFKLRTMIVDADSQKAALMERNERDGPAFKLSGDPRITSVGRFLRAVGIDELPQLWNVLIGDMALVGPRPLPCAEDAQCLPWQRRRLETKPGLTCTWQISKNREMPFSEWMRLDLQYGDRMSFTGDLGLIVRTILAVVRGRVEH